MENMNIVKSPLIPSRIDNITSTENVYPDLDDESVIICIPEELEPDLNTTCWIHRVPIKLRKVNEQAYTPQLVSIGPFHHGKPKFKSVEGHKAKYQQQFWERDFCKHIVERKMDIVEAFMRQEDRMERIRRCYAGTFELADKEVDYLAKVILRDACFIFELFLRNYERKIKAGARKAEKDYILSTPWLRRGIELDLILLENQLPFFVFIELFDFILDKQPDEIIPTRLSKCQNKSERRVSFLTFVVEFFGNYYCKGIALDMDKKMVMEMKQKLDVEQSSWQSQQIHHTTGLKRSPVTGMTRVNQSQIPSTKDSISDSVSNKVRQQPAKSLFISNLVDMERLSTIKHFTDLVRQFLCPKEYMKSVSNNSTTRISCLHSAKKLDRAGVKFLPGKNQYLVEIIRYHGNDNKVKCLPCKSLEVSVPKFIVEDDTECLMRNMMALEQCLYPLEAHICNYVSLLNQLIDTAEDVDLLILKRILENSLGSSDEVADLVNNLRDYIVEERFCYGDLCEDLNRHYNSWWSVTKETCKRVYFKDLWTGSSTIVWIFVTIFAVISVTSTLKGLIYGKKKKMN